MIYVVEYVNNMKLSKFYIIVFLFSTELVLRPFV